MSRFINFWSEFYIDPKATIYRDNIGRPLQIINLEPLFRWKFRGSFYHRQTVEDYIRKFNELRELRGLDGFLEQFNAGGPIYRIFFLHCWRPGSYPIFDQHSYRAMQFINKNIIAKKIPGDEERQICIYKKEYIPFIKNIRKKTCFPFKKIDEALYMFGKFLQNFSNLFGNI
ncbi:hypothetical protein JW979_05215 [bacterium]|nr:hypothetical protein [candidate division CSSED10-310 bacterium]